MKKDSEVLEENKDTLEKIEKDRNYILEMDYDKAHEFILDMVYVDKSELAQECFDLMVGKYGKEKCHLTTTMVGLKRVAGLMMEQQQLEIDLSQCKNKEERDAVARKYNLI